LEGHGVRIDLTHVERVADRDVVGARARAEHQRKGPDPQSQKTFVHRSPHKTRATVALVHDRCGAIRAPPIAASVVDDPADLRVPSLNLGWPGSPATRFTPCASP